MYLGKEMVRRTLAAHPDDEPERVFVRDGPPSTAADEGLRLAAATLMMVFKLAKKAERHWRKLNGSELLAKVTEGAKFINGVMEKAA